MKAQLLLLLALAVVGNATLDSYNVDLKGTTVSGLSAGGFFAVQFHVAFSSDIDGAAIFAGGPYYCAKGSLSTALTTCMSSPEMLDVSNLVSKAQSFADAGHIDPVSEIKGDKVYVYSGEDDTVVKSDVVRGTATMYEQMGATVNGEFSIDSEHCFPTENFGNPCTKLGSPYISACQYNGAEEAMSTIYSGLKPAVAMVSENLMEFSQSAYASHPDMSFGANGYVYVPTACQDKSTKCRLHISFHGCEQTIADIGTEYITKTGIAGIAEANNIIVLYPQVKRSYYAPSNPDGCWDWWGYSTPGLLPIYHSAKYVYKTGPQMAAVWQMAQVIAGEASAPSGSTGSPYPDPFKPPY